MPGDPDDTFEDLVSALEAQAFAEGALRPAVPQPSEPAPQAMTPAQAPPEAPRRG